MKAQTFDIELALLDPGGLWQQAETVLAASYLVDDKKDKGWGLVARAANLQGESLEAQLDEFLSSLSGHEDWLKQCKPILRIAVFNPNVTCTVLLPKLERLCSIGAKLELSVYPVDD